MRTRSATRCAKSALSTSMSVGRSISPTGFPISNAGIRRRRGGTIAGRVDGCLSALVLEIAGLLGGAFKAFGWISFDLLGFLAASAGGVMAWIEAKQHRNLATAYGIASQELASIATELPTLNDEERWASFVGQAEEAISREHTLWRTVRPLQTQRRLNPDLTQPGIRAGVGGRRREEIFAGRDSAGGPWRPGS
jgi:hypothetical protein